MQLGGLTSLVHLLGEAAPLLHWLNWDYMGRNRAYVENEEQIPYNKGIF